MLTAADDALKSAAGAGNKASRKVDEKFKRVIFLLNRIKTSLFTPDPNIGGTVGREAKMGHKSDKSESPSTILSALSMNLHAKVKFPSVSLILNADES